MMTDVKLVFDVLSGCLKKWTGRVRYPITEDGPEEPSFRYRGVVLIDGIEGKTSMPLSAQIRKRFSVYRGQRLAFVDKGIWVSMLSENLDGGGWHASNIIEWRPVEDIPAQVLERVDVFDIVLAVLAFGSHCQARIEVGVNRHKHDMHMVAELVEEQDGLIESALRSAENL